jgi:hypothetical protein
MSDQPNGPTTEELLAEREDIFNLTRLDLWRRYVDQPDRAYLTFGEGSASQETQKGNPGHPFYGIAVLNPSPKTIYVGFEAGAAQGSPLFCPPGFGLVWPAKYMQASFAVSAADAAGPAANITVLRLQYPPAPAVFPLGPESLSALNSQPLDLAIPEADTELLPANALRRGLDIYNIGATTVRLALGRTAEAKRGLVLAKGERWTGRISEALWRGSIHAFSEGGAGTLAVLEA